MNKNKKGFTLIELLVVIAIIGILSGIVLTSLGTARTKAKTASAIASMSSMRAEGELAFSGSTYPTTLCNVTTVAGASTIGAPLTALSAAAVANGATDIDCTADSTTAPVSKWAVASVLLDFCGDSSGFAGDTKALADLGVCS